MENLYNTGLGLGHRLKIYIRLTFSLCVLLLIGDPRFYCVQIVLYRKKLVLDLNTIESWIPNKQQNTQWDCQSGIDL